MVNDVRFRVFSDEDAANLLSEPTSNVSLETV